MPGSFFFLMNLFALFEKSIFHFESCGDVNQAILWNLSYFSLFISALIIRLSVRKTIINLIMICYWFKGTQLVELFSEFGLPLLLLLLLVKHFKVILFLDVVRVDIRVLFAEFLISSFLFLYDFLICKLTLQLKPFKPLKLNYILFFLKSFLTCL